MTAANETYDVFVSYSRADGRHAAEIDSALRNKGLKSFFDRHNLDPGLPWVRALEKAIGSAKAAIVLIGPHGFGNTQQYERELAIIRQTRESSLRVISVILPKTASDLHAHRHGVRGQHRPPVGRRDRQGDRGPAWP